MTSSETGNSLCIDLYCGLGGWAEGFLAEGFDVAGFDIERHDYGTGGYPGQLVLQDVLTLHGSQFKDAAVIVASPPCQKYSYMAMPWKRAKALATWYRQDEKRIMELNALFDACFRIQREASEAAGRHIPLIVENVRGAQPWVGRSAWNFGSFHLWGDIPALMPIPSRRAQKVNPDGRKVVGHLNKRNGECHTRHLTNQDEHVKQPGLSGPLWFDNGAASFGSKYSARARASAQIAKIPFPLAQHIARCFKKVPVCV